MLRATSGFLTRSSKRAACAGVLLIIAQSAFAVPVTYQFSTSSSPFGINAAVNAALAGSSVTGSFVYNSDGPLIVTAPDGTSIYGAISNMTGSVAGNNFADATGIAAVNNDGFVPAIPVPGDFPSDFMQIVVNGPVAIPDFTGFDVVGFTLINVRLFWIENWAPIDTPDFLNDNSAPALLPGISGRLALDFIVQGEPFSFANTVFFDGLIVTPASVSEPGTLALLSLGLLGLATARRRRARG